MTVASGFLAIAVAAAMWGVAASILIYEALEAPITVPQNPQTVGALGAALYAETATNAK